MLKIDYADKATWDLLCSGRSRGVFQCESKLVQQWLYKMKPINLWELSAVVALVRPGALQSGQADLYVDYKNNGKEFESFGHPIIDSIFDVNHHCMIYQENTMSLGSRLAWADLPEKERKIKVDILRKGIGKKNQAKLLEIGRDFESGCIRNGVEPEVAKKLFDILKNCGRYLFNLSHSIKYARLAFDTAYYKTHYPLQFFATYLSYAKFRPFKWEELAGLIRDAFDFNIEILVPQWNLKNENFRIVGDKIVYGLSHMKYGPRDLDGLPQVNSVEEFIKMIINPEYRRKLRSNTIIALISVGSFTGIGIGRKSLLSLFKFIDELTPKETDSLRESLEGNSLFNANNIQDHLNNVIAKATKVRQNKLSSLLKFVDLDEYDTPGWIQQVEIEYLGTYITAVSIDDKISHITTTVKDCLGEHSQYKKISVPAIIGEIRHTTTKSGANPGQKMAQISIYDVTAQLDRLPVFPEKYNQYSDILITGNEVLLDMYYGNNGWIINTISPINA